MFVGGATSGSCGREDKWLFNVSVAFYCQVNTFCFVLIPPVHFYFLPLSYCFLIELVFSCQNLPGYTPTAGDFAYKCDNRLEDYYGPNV